MAEVKETKEVKTTAAKKTAPKTATTAKKTTTTTKKATAPKAETAEVKVEAPKAEVKVAGPMLKIKLVKSASGRLAKQQKTLVALGLSKIGSETVKPDNAQIRGMIFVVKHLVSVESVKEN